MDSSEFDSCWPLNSTGLTAGGHLHAYERLADGAQAFDQVGGIEGHGDVFAIHVDVEDLLGLGFIHRACGQREFLAGEGHADRSVAFGHEGHALDGADEILAC